MLYEFTLKGLSGLLMHLDDVEASDLLKEWQTNPDNANLSKKGDDRTPPWTWQTYLYHDGVNVALPSANFMACVRQAGVKKQIPNARGGKSYQECTQSGIIPGGEFFDFKVMGKNVPVSKIVAMHDLPFAEQKKAAVALGFRLDVRRAAIGKGKHVRVRPRFDSWLVTGRFEVTAPELTPEVVASILQIAGGVGLGDYRPGSKKPGSFGRFATSLKRID
jgi:hypothetical protein